MAEFTIESRPWQPQDLLDDLQLLINEEPDNYLNGRRTTLCMARDYLQGFFSTAAGQIVRCRDCGDYENGECVNPYIWMSDGAHMWPDPDFFCAHGERRQNDATD